MFKMKTIPRRTIGTIKYSVHKLEDESKSDETMKRVRFNYDGHGCAIDLYIHIDEGDDDSEIINKAMRDLLNFDSLTIHDTYK